MKRFLCIILLAIIGCLKLQAQQPAKKERILLVLDASSGMNNTWHDSLSLFDGAKAFIMQLMDSVYARNNEVEFALRVYGHQYSLAESNCNDTKLEVMYSMDNYTQMGLRLSSLHKTGKPALFSALNEALEQDVPDGSQYNYHIVILTGSNSSCNEDLCSLKKKFVTDHIPLPGIINLNKTSSEVYNCIGFPSVLTSTNEIPGLIKQLLTTCCRIPQLIKKKFAIIDSEQEKPRRIISSELPKKLAANTKPITPTKTQQIATSQKQPNRIKNTIQTGYLKLSNVAGVGKITLYYFTGNTWQFYTDRQITPSNIDEHIILPVNVYKLRYGNNQSKEFKIVANMITSVKL